MTKASYVAANHHFQVSFSILFMFVPIIISVHTLEVAYATEKVNPLHFHSLISLIIFVTGEMLRFSFFTGLVLLLFNSSFLWSEVTKFSGDVPMPLHCQDPCQPTTPLPPPSSLPVYGTPPPPPPPSPPSEPVYKAPPSPLPPAPSEPVYKAPPAPSEPVYEAPSPPVGASCQPPPPLTTGPLYRAPPPPPLLPGNCQPSMQNCVNPPPNTDIYQPLDSASHFPLYCLHPLVLMFLFFLHF